MEEPDAPWEIRGLGATRPDPALQAKLQLFGQFIGDWVIVDRRSPDSDALRTKQVGEVHFNWILGGRGIQDVWGLRDPPTGKFLPIGTTLRFYDRNLDKWRTTWISPLQFEVRTFIGRLEGDEIVMKERHRPPGQGERWFYSHLRPRSFRWRAERRVPPAGHWEVVETMMIERSSDP